MTAHTSTRTVGAVPGRHDGGANRNGGTFMKRIAAGLIACAAVVVPAAAVSADAHGAPRLLRTECIRGLEHSFCVYWYSNGDITSTWS